MTSVDLQSIRDRDRDEAGRRMPGHLTECPGCGLVVRRLPTGTVAGSVLVAPDPFVGAWSGPLWGYGTERRDGREPETRGWLWVLQRSGLAVRFDAPPSTVSGFRDHALDCGHAAAERASMS